MTPVIHLTMVRREGSSKRPWRPSCDCGWVGDDRELKRDAITAAEFHWLSQAVVVPSEVRDG